MASSSAGASPEGSHYVGDKLTIATKRNRDFLGLALLDSAAARGSIVLTVAKCTANEVFTVRAAGAKLVESSGSRIKGSLPVVHSKRQRWRKLRHQVKVCLHTRQNSLSRSTSCWRWGSNAASHQPFPARTATPAPPFEMRQPPRRRAATNLVRKLSRRLPVSQPHR